MSYCRFSSDDWRSDVYVYEDVAGGFTIHTAGNRVVGDIPKLDWNLLNDSEEDRAKFLEQYNTQMAFLDTAEREEIDILGAGDTLHADTAEDCMYILMGLRAVGFNIPQSAIDALKEEANETKALVT